MTRVVLLLVCILLTIGLTMASYSNNLLNLIIRPAGRSRSFKWLGRGDINNIPYNIPRPVFIPRWIPKDRPQYIAKWVPTTPGPQSINHSPHQPSFSPPNTNSIVQKPDLVPTYAVVPAPAPAIVSIPKPSPVSTYTSLQEPTGYAQPHPDDIITVDNLPPSGPIIPAQPTSPPEVYSQIPETAIRDTLNNVPVVPGEPSFSLLIQDEEASVDLSGFRPPDPESILVLDNGNSYNPDIPVDIVPSIVVHNDASNIINPSVPKIISTSQESDNFLFTDFHEDSPVELAVHKGTVTNEVSDPIFILNPDSTTLLTDAETFSSQQDNSGKVLLGPALLSQPIAAIPANIIKEPNLETLFIEDVQAQISQDSIVNKLNTDKATTDNLLILQDIHSNISPQIGEGLQNTPEFQSVDNSHFITGDQLGPDNSHFITGDQLAPEFEENLTPIIVQEPQLIIGSKPNEFSGELSSDVLLSEGPGEIIKEFQVSSTLPFSGGSEVIQVPHTSSDSQFIDTPPQILEQPFSQQPFSQNSQTNSNNEIFIVSNTGAKQTEEFQPDQVAQFSNFQPSVQLNFQQLSRQAHESNYGNFKPSFLRPPLIAPPASPVLDSSGPIISNIRKDSRGNLKPINRSLLTDITIPQPVPIPIDPLGSVTLNFPREEAGVRQARVATGFLPFGARLNPRPFRNFSSHPLLVGK